MPDKTPKFRFPFIDLEKSIQRAQEVYEEEKQAPAMKSVLLKHWNYGEKSSGGIRTLAALVSFGLLEKVGRNRFRLTRDAVMILRGQGEGRVAAIQSCALGPKAFRKVRDEHSSGIPSDTSLRQSLIVEHRVPDSTADLFVKNFKSTLRFAGLDKSAPKEPTSADQSSDEGAEAPESGGSSVTDVPPQPPVSKRFQTYLNERTVVDLTIRGTATKKDFSEWIESLKFHVRAFPDALPEEPTITQEEETD